MAVTDGLFSGASIGEVRQLLNKERDDRIRQAQLDNFAMTQNPYAAMIAKSNQQLAEAVTGGARALGQATGLDTGMFAGLGQDARLTKAVERDAVRKEVMDMAKNADLSKPEDVTKIANVLASRGYPVEAFKFLEQGRAQGQEDRADKLMGLKRDQFKWKQIVDDKTLTQGDIKLKLNELQTKHNIKIDYEKLGVSKDDLKLQGNIAFAKIAWDKEKNNRSQGEVERSNRAREALTSRGYDINEDGNVIKRKQLTETERMNTARIGNMEKDIKLRSRVQDFNEDFKNKSFGWEKKMDLLNADLKKQGLEIRREGNRIQLVGIETQAETSDKNRSAQLTQTRERILSRENINRYNELGKNKRAELDRELRKSLEDAKTLRNTKTIKAPTKDERLAVLNFVEAIRGVKDPKTNKTGPNLQNSLQEFYEGSDWGSIDSESIGALASHAKKIMESHRRKGIPLEITEAVQMIVDANLGAGKFDFKRGPVPEITIEEIED